MNVRRFLELACREKSYWRRLPTQFGHRPILVSPDAALRWLRPTEKAFDSYLIDIANSIHPGEVVWDIGANVGVFSMMAAHRSGRMVLAVEADRWLAGLVMRTAQANQDCVLSVAAVAIGARPGIGEFAIAARGRASSGLVNGALSTQTGGAREVRPVRVETLDSLLRTYEAPNVIKIDVEGGELDVLRGADIVLRDVKPRLVIEIAAANFALAEDLLAGYRYHLRRMDGDNFEAVHSGERSGAGQCQAGMGSPTVPSHSTAASAMPFQTASR